MGGGGDSGNAGLVLGDETPARVLGVCVWGGVMVLIHSYSFIQLYVDADSASGTYDHISQSHGR